jgi:hypothetical protein
MGSVVGLLVTGLLCGCLLAAVLCALDAYLDRKRR